MGDQTRVRIPVLPRFLIVPPRGGQFGWWRWETKPGYIASLFLESLSQGRNPWPVWLAEVMLRPTLWKYGPRAFLLTT